MSQVPDQGFAAGDDDFSDLEFGDDPEEAALWTEIDVETRRHDPRRAGSTAELSSLYQALSDPHARPNHPCAKHLYSRRLNPPEKFRERSSAFRTVSLEEVAGSANSLGFGVLKVITGLAKERRENCALVSPLSLAVAVAMLEEGARGKVREELAAWVDLKGVISRPDTRTIIPKGAGAVANSLWHRPPKGSGGKQTSASRDLFDSKYAKLLATRYGAEVLSLRSAEEINRWVSEHTDGMIQKIIGGLDKDVTVVIVNALWFSCFWAEPFETALTKKMIFHGASETRECDMMYFRRDVRCATAKSGVVGACIALSGRRMKGGEQNPAAHGYSHLEESDLEVVIAVDPNSGVPPAPEDAEYIERRAERGEVRLWLPRSKLELPATSLKLALETLGIKSCWEWSADLPGFGGDVAKVDDVLHAAVLEFDEQGAKGAAATAVLGKAVATASFERKPPPLEIKCDHPFFVGVADKRTGIFLFAGYVL